MKNKIILIFIFFMTVISLIACTPKIKVTFEGATISYETIEVDVIINDDKEIAAENSYKAKALYEKTKEKTSDSSPTNPSKDNELLYRFKLSGLERGTEYDIEISATINGANVVIGTKRYKTKSEGGSKEEAIKINTVAEFLDIALSPTSYYEIEKDIDFENKEIKGSEFFLVSSISNAFKGYIDGKGKTISNLIIRNSDSKTYVGVFGYIDSTTSDQPSILDLNFDHISILDASYSSVSSIGIVAGRIGQNSKLKNINVTNSSVSATFAGNPSSNNNIGGVVGQNEGGMENISTTNVSVKVLVTGTASVFAGGIAGWVNSSATNPLKTSELTSQTNIEIKSRINSTYTKNILYEIGGVIGEYSLKRDLEGLSWNGVIELDGPSYVTRKADPSTSSTSNSDAVYLGGLIGLYNSLEKISNGYSSGDIYVEQSDVYERIDTIVVSNAIARVGKTSDIIVPVINDVVVKGGNHSEVDLSSNAKSARYSTLRALNNAGQYVNIATLQSTLPVINLYGTFSSVDYSLTGGANKDDDKLISFKVVDVIGDKVYYKAIIKDRNSDISLSAYKVKLFADSSDSHETGIIDNITNGDITGTIGKTYTLGLYKEDILVVSYSVKTSDISLTADTYKATSSDLDINIERHSVGNSWDTVIIKAEVYLDDVYQSKYYDTSDSIPNKVTLTGLKTAGEIYEIRYSTIINGIKTVIHKDNYTTVDQQPKFTSVLPVKEIGFDYAVFEFDRPTSWILNDDEIEDSITNLKLVVLLNDLEKESKEFVEGIPQKFVFNNLAFNTKYEVRVTGSVNGHDSTILYSSYFDTENITATISKPDGATVYGKESGEMSFKITFDGYNNELHTIGEHKAENCDSSFTFKLYDGVTSKVMIEHTITDLFADEFIKENTNYVLLYSVHYNSVSKESTIVLSNLVIGHMYTLRVYLGDKLLSEKPYTLKDDTLTTVEP